MTLGAIRGFAGDLIVILLQGTLFVSGLEKGHELLNSRACIVEFAWTVPGYILFIYQEENALSHNSK